MDVSFEVGSENEENNETVSANLSFMPLEAKTQMDGQTKNPATSAQ